MFFLELLYVMQLLLNACLTKAKNFDQFQSHMKEYVNLVELYIVTRRLMIEKKKEYRW